MVLKMVERNVRSWSVRDIRRNVFLRRSTLRFWETAQAECPPPPKTAAYFPRAEATAAFNAS